MSKTKKSAFEKKRLNALYSFGILDTPVEEEFENLTNLAFEIANMPVAMINLMDDSRQWSKSILGLDPTMKEQPRSNTVCQYAMDDIEPLEVKNLANDSRFKHFSYVKEEGGLRYYYGVPLVAAGQFPIGTLCVLDYQEGELSETQVRQLKIIADQVMTHLELKKQNRELKSLNEYKIKLMKMLSHDMRSPLHGIIGLSGLLKEELEGQPEEQLEMLDIIEQSSTKLNQMIDEVMSYSILESGELKLKPGLTDLEEIVQNIVQLYKPSTRLKNISLEVFTENIEEKVFLDGDKLEQIIGNLVSNSVKYTKPGGSVKLMLTRNQNTLELAVQDSGVGITSEKIKTLLSEDTIHPLENGKGTSGEKSTGLGLIIVKHIIKLFEGEFDIESEVGQDTKMIVRIPV